MSQADTWFASAPAVRRFVTDLVTGELQALRPGSELPAQPWPRDLKLNLGGLDCDSLEMLSLTAAVAEATHMHRSGIEDYLLARRTIGDWESIVASSLERYSDELTFHTSGSTGAPTSWTHHLSDLVEEIGQLAELFPQRWRLLCAVPAHHIYGFLFTVLLPAELKLPVTDIRGRSLAPLANDLRAGDLVVGHPAFWKAFSRAVPEVAPGVIGVTSTAPCPADLAISLAELGLERLVQIYGSSETSGIGWRDAPDREYRLLSYWRREDEAVLVRTHPDGREEHCTAPDRLSWSDSRHFYVEGRHDGAVQVGGINVAPGAVAARLREHPAVAEAAVRAMLPHEGSRLKAFIVLREEQSDLSQITEEIAHWCNHHLPTAERPKAFTFGQALPRGELGKLADWPMPLHPHVSAQA